MFHRRRHPEHQLADRSCDLLDTIGRLSLQKYPALTRQEIRTLALEYAKTANAYAAALLSCRRQVEFASPEQQLWSAAIRLAGRDDWTGIKAGLRSHARLQRELLPPGDNPKSVSAVAGLEWLAREIRPETV